MDKAFLEARLSASPRILGLKLRPLSLGHRLILERAESPFITGEAPGVVDIILAVLICSMTFEEANIALDSKRFGRKVRKWVKGLRKLNFLDKLNDFRRYWFYGHLVPNYSLKDADGAEGEEWSGTPWPQRLKITLMTHLHMTESEVLNRPLRLCWWDYLCFEEIRGNVTVLSEEIKAAEDSLQKQADEVAQLMKTKCQPNQN